MRKCGARPKAVPVLRRFAFQIGFAALFGQALMLPVFALAALMQDIRFALVSSRDSHAPSCQFSVKR